MKRLAIAIIVMALGLIAVPAQGGAATQRWVPCGEPHYVLYGQVRAHRVNCRMARRVVRKFFIESQRHGSPIRVLGFNCHGKAQRVVKCHRGKRHRVRWHGAVS